ncbi:uncharacterized protein LOC112560760 [Pomacea canaliculata]|uniref:uncharacterized protein LOC112560760 n=1 Tax=Pomacea canaliculata TaxID=400727 RepID=UPI000D73EFAC|nr:uncharacterized protein LOC112560760 [Pomacea canaliculata]
MEVRSKTWTHRVEANFTNRSSRYVDLLWVDYQGALVRYHKRMAPNELKKLITFATHPWVARDSDTGQAMYLSGRPVYITSLQKEEKREPVEVPFIFQCILWRISALDFFEGISTDLTCLFLV